MGFPFFRKMVDEFPITHCFDPNCFYRQKIPFIRHGFPMPVLEIYQSVLMGRILWAATALRNTAALPITLISMMPLFQAIT
jgi:hypothetical protein